MGGIAIMDTIDMDTMGITIIITIMVAEEAGEYTLVLVFTTATLIIIIKHQVITIIMATLLTIIKLPGITTTLRHHTTMKALLSIMNPINKQ